MFPLSVRVANVSFEFETSLKSLNGQRFSIQVVWTKRSRLPAVINCLCSFVSGACGRDLSGDLSRITV